MGTLHQLSTSDNRQQTSELQFLQALRRAVDGRVGAEASFEERETTALELTNEATRLMLEQDLQTIADSHGEGLLVDGRLFKQHEPGVVGYYSLCGTLEVSRWTYREVGVRNGPTLVPVELQAGLVEHATPALAYRVALGYAKGPMRSTEEDMLSDRRRPPSRSTLERMAKAIGTEAKRAAPRIEPHVRRAERVPAEAVSVSLGLDRTSVPMEEDIPEGECPEGRRRKRTKPYMREVPPRVNVNYRMAYVGTITLHDADGQGLITRRYASAAHEPAESLVGRLMADLRSALRQAPALAIGIVQDGAPEMWNLLRNALVKEPLVKTWYQAIDRFHVNERLGEVLRLVEPDATARKQQLSRWNDSLDNTDQAIYRIRAWLRDRLVDAAATDDEQLIAQLDPHLTFFDNNAYLMRYVRLIEHGLPIGSGATEGACRSVIGSRTKRSGQRWRPNGLEAVLTMRATYMSERLPRFWTHFSRGYRAEIRKCA